jgi:hypothetical protein
VFLLIALVALYRLLFWFPLVIAGWQVGQTVSFFTFVIFTALSIISFQGLRVRTEQ